MRVYIIVAVFGNTKENHAGMYYLAKKLKEESRNKISVISTPTKYAGVLSPVYRLLNIIIGLYLRLKVKKDDCVLLMEYLSPRQEQSVIAKILHGKVRLVAIAHLVPKQISHYYSKNEILLNVSYLDKLLVLGSSLRNYLVNIGVDKDKLERTFHYVDTDFYSSRQFLLSTNRMKVISMGNMERSYEKLSAIVKSLPHIDFCICMGKKDFSVFFENCSNVQLYKYIDESLLLDLMKQSDVSLNVMNDTVGSNVITTSLAVGLAVVASNVGSISDYVVDNESGYLFETEREAIDILNYLDSNRTQLLLVQKKASERSHLFDLPSFINWFDLFLKHVNSY